MDASRENQSEESVLICARADEPWAARGSVFTHCCSRCLARVMVAPSGQQLLAGLNTIKIICLPCWLDADDLRDANGALPEIKFAADPETVAQEAASAIPNLWRKRN